MDILSLYGFFLKLNIILYSHIILLFSSIKYIYNACVCVCFKKKKKKKAHDALVCVFVSQKNKVKKNTNT